MTASLARHDVDTLRNLIASRAEIASRLITEKLGISRSTASGKESANHYLAIRYAATLERYGWRQVEFLIATRGGRTMAIGKELLRRRNVAYVARTIGQFNIDLRAEVFVQSNEELVNLIEEVKGMDGVKELMWSEVIEVVGRKNQIPSELVTVLKRKAAIKSFE
jgi:hypothetical protein